jgi:hypothetical protein
MHPVENRTHSGHAASLPAWLFALSAAEGLLVVLWMLFTPSEADSALWLGLSKARLVMAGLAVLGGLACAAAAYAAQRAGPGVRQWKARLDGWLLEKEALLPVMVSLAMGVLVGAGLMIWQASFNEANKAFYLAQLGANFPQLSSLLERGLPMLAWGMVLAGQTLVWMALEYGDGLDQQKAGRVAGVLLANAMGLLTLAHWGILALRLEVLENIPGWYWKLHDKAVTPRHLIFVVLLGGLLLGIRWILRHPNATRRNLLIVLALAYATQLSMGIADGHGILSLRDKFLESVHRSYIHRASMRDDSVIDTIWRYEELYSATGFPGTKPPGMLSLYVALERAVNAIGRETILEARENQLATTVAYLFPLVSLVGVWMVYRFSKQYAGAPSEDAAYLSALFFLLAPNIVLLPLFLDQALYPSLFLASAMLIVTAIRSGSYRLAFGMGCALYGAIFITFSMLPLFALAVVFAAIQIWLNCSKRTLLHMAGLGLSAGLGTAAMFLLFRLALNYNFFVRYPKAMSGVYNFDFYVRVGLEPGQPVSLAQRLQQILAAGVLNNIELACLVSLPVFVLFLVRGVKSVAALVRRKISPSEMVQASLFITYILLNAYGQVRGEAGRLWMFWVPTMAIFAAIEAALLIKRRPILTYVLVVMQFITLMLTYQFQDLIV